MVEPEEFDGLKSNLAKLLCFNALTAKHYGNKQQNNGSSRDYSAFLRTYHQEDDEDVWNLNVTNFLFESDKFYY